MKKLLCVALFVPAVAFAASHKAPTNTTGLYGRVDLGAGMRTSEKISTSKTKSNIAAPVAGVGVGYQFNEFFRTDVNAQFRNTPTKAKVSLPVIGNKINNKSYAVMLNGSLDVPTDTMFTPYVTAGIGYNKLKKSEISLTGNTKDKSHLAWNAGLGLKTKIDHNIDLDLGYKFVNLGKIKNPIKNVKVQANEITAGVIVSF